MKCDETKPVCERCRRATYNCAGYDQPWMNEAPHQCEAYKRFLVRDQLYHARLDPLLPKEAVVSQGFLPLERVAQELNLSAFQENICRSFLFHKLCPRNNFSKAVSWWLNPQAESRRSIQNSCFREQSNDSCFLRTHPSTTGHYQPSDVMVWRSLAEFESRSFA